MGRGRRDSTATKAASRTAVPTSSDSTRGLVQPSCGPRTMPNVSATSAAVNSSVPGQSMPCAAGSRDSLIRRVPSSRIKTAISAMAVQRAPAQALDQEPGRHRSERKADAERGPQETERPRALRALELLRQQRGRRGQHQRAAQAFDGAQQIEQEQVGAQADQQGRDDECPEPRHEATLAANLVADRARRHDAAAEGDGIGVDDPAQGGLIAAQVAPDRRRGYRRAGEYQGMMIADTQIAASTLYRSSTAAGV